MRTMPSHDPLHTDMHQASGWYAMLPPPAPANRLKGEQKADWVVAAAINVRLGSKADVICGKADIAFLMSTSAENHSNGVAILARSP